MLSSLPIRGFPGRQVFPTNEATWPGDYIYMRQYIAVIRMGLPGFWFDVRGTRCRNYPENRISRNDLVAFFTPLLARTLKKNNRGHSVFA